MNKIIEMLAKNHIVEDIVKNVAKDSYDEDLPDLCQDIYMTLMEKDEDWLLGIYERGQINYFITRMAMNNINSVTSRYYYLYKKNKLKQTSIDEYKTKETAD
jgi:hypothetical protein